MYVVEDGTLLTPIETSLKTEIQNNTNLEFPPLGLLVSGLRKIRLLLSLLDQGFCLCVSELTTRHQCGLESVIQGELVAITCRWIRF